MSCGCRCHTLAPIPFHQDLDVYRGDTLDLVLLMRELDGTPADISGRSYSATIRAAWDSVTSVPFSVSVDLATSTVTLSLSDTQTQTDVPRRGVWDLQQVIAATGDITTLVRGAVVACHDIT